jgi:hypothetical protein
VIEAFALRRFRVVSHSAPDGDVVDPAGALAASFAVTGGALVLLRPDGYVGAISDGANSSAMAWLLRLVGAGA